MKLNSIRPGKPIESAYVESFVGRLRDECLNENWFLNLRDAREIIDSWRIDYCEGRPNSLLGGISFGEHTGSTETIAEVGHQCSGRSM